MGRGWGESSLRMGRGGMLGRCKEGLRGIKEVSREERGRLEEKWRKSR